MKYYYLFFILLTASGCGEGTPVFENLEVGSSLAMDKTALLEAPHVSQSINTNTASIERKLIKNGQLSFEVADLEATKKSVESTCKNFKGYIASENMNAFGDRQQHTVEIRVPAASYDSLLFTIEALALKIENKSTNVQDVTEEFIDVAARLKTKQQLENRYLELLKQANKIEEIVAIESQLASVRAELESMEGRLKYLNDQVSYSTLHVSYYQRVASDYGFIIKLKRGLGQGWANLLDFTVVLVNLWPFFIILVGGWWFVKKYRSRKKN